MSLPIGPLASTADGPLFEGTADNDTLLWDEATRSWKVGPGTGGGGTSKTDTFTPAAPGQTVFNLSAMPSAPANLRWSVNGVLYVQGVDYTVAGAVCTWLDALFTLDTTDTCQAFYQTT